MDKEQIQKLNSIIERFGKEPIRNVPQESKIESLNSKFTLNEELGEKKSDSVEENVIVKTPKEIRDAFFNLQ